MTICRDCKHEERTSYLPYCYASPKETAVNFVTGHQDRRWQLCLWVNDGNCKKFEQRVSWWQRIRRFVGVDL